MKFAICNETFQDWPFDKAFAFARECGYTGIEFAPFTIHKNAYEISADRRREIRRQAEDAGLTVVGLHWLLAFTEGYYLTSPEADVRRRTSEYLGELARLCRDLGGRVLVLGSPKQRNLLPGVTHDQAMEYAADVLRGVVPTLEDCGVVLAAEPLGPEEGDFLRTAELGVQLIQMVDSPRCRLAFGRQGHVHRAEADRRHHSRQRAVDRAFSRQRPEPARSRHGERRLSADLRRPPGDQLPRLGLGRSVRLHAGRGNAGPRQHRIHAAVPGFAGN